MASACAHAASTRSSMSRTSLSRSAAERRGASRVFAPSRPLTEHDREHAMSIQPRPYAVLCGGLGGSRFVDALARRRSRSR